MRNSGINNKKEIYVASNIVIDTIYAIHKNYIIKYQNNDIYGLIKICYK